MSEASHIGASRGIGLETVRAALRAGHRVHALARSAASMSIQDTKLVKVSGDALDRDTIRDALQDVDVVIQTLGVNFAPKLIFEGTTLFSDSTRILIDAMKVAGVKRLIAVTGLGAGDSRGHGGFIYDAVVFPLLLKRVYDDKDVQEWMIRSSGLGPWSAPRRSSSAEPEEIARRSMRVSQADKPPCPKPRPDFTPINPKPSLEFGPLVPTA